MNRIRTIIQLISLGVFLFFISQGKTLVWLALFGTALIATIFFGRIYCGYMCPMNTIMKLSNFLSKKLNLRTHKVPKILKSKILPWVVLMMSVLSMLGARRLFHKEIPILLILLLLSFMITLRYEPWVFHNHICPFGALLSIPGRISMHSVQVEQSKCIGCKKCEKVCDAEAIIVNEENRKAAVNKTLCHQCQACIGVCPVQTINYK